MIKKKNLGKRLSLAQSQKLWKNSHHYLKEEELIKVEKIENTFAAVKEESVSGMLFLRFYLHVIYFHQSLLSLPCVSLT